MVFIKTIAVAVLSVTELFILTKIMGRRQISQLSFFDYIIGISIGSIAAEMSFSDFEKSWKHAVSMLVYSLFAILFSYLGDKSIRLRKFIEGEPLVLINKGKIYRNNFKKSKMDINEFLTQCRINGYFDLEDIQTAIIEPNGHITFLPKNNKRPVNPDDLKIETEPSTISLTVISDGIILNDNLKKLGKEKNWLNKKLSEQKYPSYDKIFLCMTDGNKLTVYKK